MLFVYVMAGVGYFGWYALSGQLEEDLSDPPGIDAMWSSFGLGLRGLVLLVVSLVAVILWPWFVACQIRHEWKGDPE